MGETMEDSALQGIFGEAGGSSTLGPSLADIEYETWKAKKGRMYRVDIVKKVNLMLKDKCSGNLGAIAIDVALIYQELYM